MTTTEKLERIKTRCQELLAIAKDREIRAFEDWLAETNPSGDAERVHDQWEKSSEYMESERGPEKSGLRYSIARAEYLLKYMPEVEKGPSRQNAIVSIKMEAQELIAAWEGQI